MKSSLLQKNDNLIVEYARKLIQSKGMQKKAYIKDKVREVTRFLIQVRKSSGPGKENLCMKDCINPTYFSLCLSAVKELTGFDEGTASYRVPSLALKISHALTLLRGRQLKAGSTRRYETLTTSVTCTMQNGARDRKICTGYIATEKAQ